MRAIDRALKGVSGKTALHICFGYAHVHRGASKPQAYSFLPELEDSKIDIVSVEAAQPKLNTAILKALRHKTIMLGVVDLNDSGVESAENRC